MTYPIIDASKQSVKQFEAQATRAQALRSVAWYRLARPVLVLAMWALAVAYMRWCLVNAGPGELSLEALTPGIAGISFMAAALTLWTCGRQLDQRRRRQVRRMPAAHASALDTPQNIVLAVDAGRRLVAYHDDDGFVSRVMPMPEAVRQAA